MLGLAAALERGVSDRHVPLVGFVGPLVSRAWELASHRLVVRSLSWPAHVRVVAVGGATLGGSSKTSVAIACAAEIAASGARTALVGHGYRAKPGRARVVAPDDRIDEVGDEALLCARALASLGVAVVVAPTRSQALAFAVQSADVVVVDGVAQTAPRRASLALLAVDALEPWGAAQALPPHGDLRAARATLLSACDAVVAVGDGEAWPGFPVDAAKVESRGAWVDEGTLLTWDVLRSARVGLFSALARPERVTRSLAVRGVVPRVTLRVRDHGPVPRRVHRALRRAGRDLDLWLATPKCALHVAALPNVGSATVATLDYRVALPAALCSRLRRLGVP